MLHRPHRHPDDVAVRAGDPLRFQDLVDVLQAASVVGALGGVAGRDPHHRLHGQAEGGQVKFGVVAAQDARILQPADPLGDRRRAQIYPPSKLGEGEPSVLLKGLQEPPVRVVQIRR